MSSITHAHNSPPKGKELALSPEPLPPGADYQKVGGIYILNVEGLRWFKEKYGRELPKDHSADASEDQPSGAHYIPRRDVHWCDFLAATQVERREVWEHVPVIGESLHQSRR
ncbi:hypothetical protein C8R45DRAFT_1091974 [Mycena sanguinolenta]|nr:hypothetical protein C8R45DRAFT_1091974 [Mycena sanguinolenta]